MQIHEKNPTILETHGQDTTKLETSHTHRKSVHIDSRLILANESFVRIDNYSIVALVAEHDHVCSQM